jgi:hypothetical protein
MEHPVDITFTTSLKRSRLRLIIKGILLIPHMIWLMLWSIPVSFAMSWMFLCALFAGRTPEKTYQYVLRHFQYQMRIGAWSLMLTEISPPFNGTDPYEDATRVTPPAEYRQRRLGVLFRALMAIPAIIVAYGYMIGLIFVTSIAAPAILILGRIPERQWRFIARAHVFFARLAAYLIILTNVEPAKLPDGEPAWDSSGDGAAPVTHAVGSPVMAGAAG